jgi:hypothetical protein
MAGGAADGAAGGSPATRVPAASGARRRESASCRIITELPQTVGLCVWVGSRRLSGRVGLHTRGTGYIRVHVDLKPHANASTRTLRVRTSK